MKLIVQFAETVHIEHVAEEHGASVKCCYFKYGGGLYAFRFVVSSEEGYFEYPEVYPAKKVAALAPLKFSGKCV